MLRREPKYPHPTSPRWDASKCAEVAQPNRSAIFQLLKGGSRVRLPVSGIALQCLAQLHKVHDVPAKSHRAEEGPNGPLRESRCSCACMRSSPAKANISMMNATIQL